MYTIGNLQAEDITYINHVTWANYIIVSPRNMVCVTTLPCKIPLQISYSVHMCQLVGSGQKYCNNVQAYFLAHEYTWAKLVHTQYSKKSKALTSIF